MADTDSFKALGLSAEILQTLGELGYVRGDGRLFTLLPRTLKLGYAYLSSQPLWRLAHPMLEAVAREMFYDTNKEWSRAEWSGVNADEFTSDIYRSNARVAISCLKDRGVIGLATARVDNKARSG